MLSVQSAYSHGLESIYAIETIDVASIRRFESTRTPTVPSPTIPLQRSDPLPAQLEFDFGDEFRCWIEPFILREPIQVLELSWHAEKILMAHGKTRIGDLRDMEPRDFVFFKGMGQGHIDEVQQKLRRYLEGKVLERCSMIDFNAWLRVLLTALDRKKVFVGLEGYRLSNLLAMTPAESGEISRLTAEKRQAWIKELIACLQHAERVQAVKEDMRRIVEAFVKPWIRSRHDLADKQELTERLLRVSERGSRPMEALRFFSEVYFDMMFPLGAYLYEVDTGLYCSSKDTAEQYKNLVEKALTYFYHAGASYQLSHLISLLERDFAMSWHGFPEGFVEKALRQSPRFRVRKGESGLMIRLS